MAEKLTGSSDDKLTLSAFVIVVLFLGINFVAVKFSNQELEPFWGAALRFIVASILLFAITRIRNIPLPTGAALIGAVLFGLFAFAINFGFLYWALTRVSAGMASVMFASVPLITLLIASLIGIEKITGRGILGALIVIGGLGLVFAEQLKFDVHWTYLAAVLTAVVSAAASGIVVKYFPRSHPIATNTIGMSVAAVILLVLSIVFGETFRLPTLTPTWLALGWLITSSIVGFVLMVWILSRWTATATSYIGVVTPLVTVAAASILAGENPTPAFLIGGLFVLFGVYVGALSPQTSASKVKH